MSEAQHITSTHSVFLRLRKSKNYVRSLDSTIHLYFKNPTKSFVDICVYIFSIECVIVNKISIRSWMSYTINRIKYYYIILLYNMSVNIFGGARIGGSTSHGSVGTLGTDRNSNQRLIM